MLNYDLLCIIHHIILAIVTSASELKVIRVFTVEMLILVWRFFLLIFLQEV